MPKVRVLIEGEDAKDFKADKLSAALEEARDYVGTRFTIQLQAEREAEGKLPDAPAAASRE